MRFYLTTAIDWSGYHTVADIGGARGNLASLLLTALPHLTGHVFDQPANGGPFADHVRMHGVADRIGFTGGDLFRDPFPPADVLVIGHVLADFSLAERKSLVAKAAQAVTAGGTLLVYDPMTEPDRPELGALVASLHMLLMSERIVPPVGASRRPFAASARKYLSPSASPIDWTSV